MKSRHLKYPIIAAAVLVLMVSSVLALYKKQTDTVENTFTAAVSAIPVITEEFSGSLKEDVCIRIPDEGYPVYIRCAVVVSWKDADGNLHSEIPVPDTDYLLETGEDWTLQTDGFYYYRTPVQEGETTPLIKTCKPLGDAPNAGYQLSVEILSQTMQAVGSSDDEGIPAHQDGWGIALAE